jgi:hypothetical protein
MMRPSAGVLRTCVRYALWGGPWLCTLAFSASLAFALNVAVAGDPANSESQHGGAAARSSAMALAQLEAADPGDGCDTSPGRLLYVGLNSWIPAEPKVTPCPT